MRIGIDARWIFREMSGIGIYTRELIRQLSLIDKDNHYILFFEDAELKKRLLEYIHPAQAGNFSACVVPFGLFSIANQWQMPRVLEAQRMDVYHSPNYLIPLRAFPRNQPGRIRCVTNLHDLIPLMFPEYTPRSRKRRLLPVYRWLMRQVGMRSDIILTGSASARDDVIQYLRIPRQRQDNVLVISDGVAPRFKPATQSASRDTKVILWVGRPDPYKNLTSLIEAFARLKKSCRFPITLRLVGARDDRYPEAGQLTKKLGLGHDVIQTGYVNDAELLKEYQQADVFVLPSRYEGFGLPVLEAMACGIPVICSNKGALPEVAGDAALQVDPPDIQGLAEAIERVLTNPRMAEDMTTRGLRQASQFTWTATAQETLQAYWQALA